MEEKPPFTPRKPLSLSLEFEGQCFDEDDKAWTHCMEFEHEGRIDKDLDPSFYKVQSAADGREIDLHEASKLIAIAGEASGAVFVSPPDGEMTRLSGFFVSNRFFLTCAHFVVTSTAREEMKNSGSEIVTISTKNRAYAKGSPAHLVLYDRDHDYALFCLDKNLSQPTHLDIDTHFPGVDQMDFNAQLAYRRAFTIGYNSMNYADYFPEARDRVIANLSPDSRHRAQAAPSRTSDFGNIFKPERKTLSIGRLNSKPSDNGITWNHCITGWYGVSGAMIACLDQPLGEAARIQVLGLFSHGAHGNHNGMMLLTTDILLAIRKAIRSHTLSD